MSQDFIERPHKNEKEGAIAYVQELLKQDRDWDEEFLEADDYMDIFGEVEE